MHNENLTIFIDLLRSNSFIGLSNSKHFIKQYSCENIYKNSDFLAESVKEIFSNDTYKKKIKYVIVNAGVGSYTSIRTALSFAIGLAQNSNIKLLYTYTKDILYFLARQTQNFNNNASTLLAIPARGKEVYIIEVNKGVFAKPKMINFGNNDKPEQNKNLEWIKEKNIYCFDKDLSTLNAIIIDEDIDITGMAYALEHIFYFTLYCVNHWKSMTYLGKKPEYFKDII